MKKVFCFILGEIIDNDIFQVRSGQEKFITKEIAMQFAEKENFLLLKCIGQKTKKARDHGLLFMIQKVINWLVILD